MDNIIEKLKPDNVDFSTWVEQDIGKLLELCQIVYKNESKIYNLIYSCHDCDSWEDIFRDFDENLLDGKITGVEQAIRLFDKN